MQDVIRKIIKIEEKAQAIMESAVKEKQAMEQAYDEKLKTLESRIMGDARRKIKELREREFEESEIERLSVSRVCDEKLSKMETVVLKNRERWIDELVSQVIKG